MSSAFKGYTFKNNSGFFYSAHAQGTFQDTVFSCKVCGTAFEKWDLLLNIAPCNGLQGAVAHYAANQTRNTGANPFSALGSFICVPISALGSFICVTQHTGPMALCPIWRYLLLNLMAVKTYLVGRTAACDSIKHFVDSFYFEVMSLWKNISVYPPKFESLKRYWQWHCLSDWVFHLLVNFPAKSPLPFEMKLSQVKFCCVHLHSYRI